MATNQFFKPHTYSQEQGVLQSLVVESIKSMGMDVKYIPRTLVDLDNVFGESSMSTFDNAIDIEMFLESADGFEGEGNITSIFGYEQRDSITLVCATTRWEQIRNEKVLTETGYNLQLESSQPFLFDGQANVEMEEGGREAYQLLNDRPYEGDLIYVPMTKGLFEIKSVASDKQFYQLGERHSFQLKCELFVYSSENLNTNVTDIDSIEDRYTNDISDFNITTESGDDLNTEDGDDVLSEVEISDDGADNTDFLEASAVFIDDSDLHPFLS